MGQMHEVALDDSIVIVNRKTAAEPEVNTYPVLGLRNCEVLPGKRQLLFVGRAKSRAALAEAIRSNTLVLFATQKDSADDDPAGDALYGLATVARIVELRMVIDGNDDEETIEVIVEGIRRAKIIKFGDRTDYLEADTVPFIAAGLGHALLAEARAQAKHKQEKECC
jgi:ATP-dependent Lon protease